MKRLLRFILSLSTIGAVTWALGTPQVKLDPQAAQDVARRRTTLAQEHPRVVLLGNSMLGHGVNVIHFSLRTGLPTVKLWDGGVASAWRYLMLKNLIAPTRQKPEVVVVFFKSTYLTEPNYRVDGKYKQRIDALRSVSEPLLDQLAYGAQRRDPLAYLVSRCWPLDRQREIVKPTVENWVKNQVGQGLRVGGTTQVDESIARVFADSNMNTALFSKAQLAEIGATSRDRRDFQALLNNSFLPAEIEIAREAGIQLIYVRLKREPDAQYQEEGRGASYDDAYMTGYMKDLRDYLGSQGVPLLDFAEETQLGVRHFADGDHLNEEGRLLFTAMLAEALQGKLPAPSPADHPFAALTEITEPIPLNGPFKARPPFGWIAAEPEWSPYSSGMDDAFRSVLEVLEDGTPLGPRNASTEDIASLGAGRYSHWTDSIYFSTSDNSDPNTNGRTYTLRFTLPQ